MNATASLKRQLLGPCGRPCVLRSRFQPPWERLSLPHRTADDFFHSAPKGNPDVFQPIMAQRDAVKSLLSSLPHEAPKHVDAATAPLPAWEAYVGALSSAPTRDQTAQVVNQLGVSQYSSDTARQLLGSDFQVKLPFKFTAQTLESTRGSELPWPLGGAVGIVLDIDGVIVAGDSLIEGSREAIQHLIALKIPFVFMTNGGGHTEEVRAAKLSDQLGVEIRPSQVVLSHTPMKFLAREYQNKPVLVCGPHPTALEAAHAYGFNMAVSCLELQIAYPELVPLKLWPSIWRPLVDKNRRERQDLLDSPTLDYPHFDAVFIFSDRHFDGLSDTQVIVDIVTAPHGKIGSRASKFQTVPVYMSADDLFWPTRAPLPRLGQGAIKEMISSVFESVTGEQLQVVQYGKPRLINYAYAERALTLESHRLGWDPKGMRLICMVGDNLETDIRGANASRGNWMSVHVLSGVGSLPDAARTLLPGDEEAEWLLQHVSNVPDYVAPTLHHFLTEMEHFGEHIVTLHSRDSRARSAALPPNPVDLAGVFKFPTTA